MSFSVKKEDVESVREKMSVILGRVVLDDLEEEIDHYGIIERARVYWRKNLGLFMEKTFTPNFVKRVTKLLSSVKSEPNFKDFGDKRKNDFNTISRKMDAIITLSKFYTLLAGGEYVVSGKHVRFNLGDCKNEVESSLMLADEDSVLTKLKNPIDHVSDARGPEVLKRALQDAIVNVVGSISKHFDKIYITDAQAAYRNFSWVYHDLRKSKEVSSNGSLSTSLSASFSSEDSPNYKRTKDALAILSKLGMLADDVGKTDDSQMCSYLIKHIFNKTS